jgi:hypothetical protein
MSRIRTALVGIVAAGLMLITAGAASATPEPSVPTQTTQREVVALGNGWFINSATTTTTTVTSSNRTTSHEVPVSESRPQSETVYQTVPGYKAQIQQPINPDKTSSWPAKRGVIPVQFKLTKSEVKKQATKSWTETRSGTKTEQRTDVVTTTNTTKKPSFQSVCGSDDTAWSVFGLYEIPAVTEVKDITKLQSNFTWDAGQSGGGSLRWDIGTNLGDIHIYYGDSHNWTGTSGSGANLIAATDDRFDDSNTSIAGGTFYNTWEQILDKFEGVKVNNASMVLESCWKVGDQKVNIGSATVGIHGVEYSVITNPTATRSLTPVDSIVEGDWQQVGDPTFGDWQKVAGSESVGGWTTVSESAPVQTNAIPSRIVVIKGPNDPTPIDISETLSSAQGDTSGWFRQIDGKYMYNLKAETLGAGNFNVYIAPDGYTNAQGNAKVLDNPGVFELK